ncbi:ABC transporter F family member 4-like [Folsomia candida]|nr:ABC transporter F family member 4-like [Folsomia candida]
MDTAEKRSRQYKDARNLVNEYEDQESGKKSKKAVTSASESEEDSDTSTSSEDCSEDDADSTTSEEEEEEVKRRTPKKAKRSNGGGPIVKEALFSIKKDEKKEAPVKKNETRKRTEKRKGKEEKVASVKPKREKAEKEKASTKKAAKSPRIKSVKPKREAADGEEKARAIVEVKNFAPPGEGVEAEKAINSDVLSFNGRKAGFPAGILPRQHMDGAAGYDLLSTQSACIPPGGMMKIETNLVVGVPEGYMGLIKGRSGAALRYMVDVMAGVVDHGYTGTLGILLLNLGNRPYQVDKYDRVAQLVVVKLWGGLLAYGEESPSLPKIVPNQRGEKRGDKGFGSTGGYTSVDINIFEPQSGQPSCSKTAYVPQ